MELTPRVIDHKVVEVADWKLLSQMEVKGKQFVQLEKDGIVRWFDLVEANNGYTLKEALSITTKNDVSLFNGEPQENANFYQVGHLSKIVMDGKEVEKTGPVGPVEYLSVIEKSDLVRFANAKFTQNGEDISLYYQKVTSGKDFLLPGLKYKIGKGSSLWSKLDFISLMLAAFI